MRRFSLLPEVTGARSGEKSNRERRCTGPASSPPPEGAGPNHPVERESPMMHHQKSPRDLIIHRLHASNQSNVCDHFLRLDVQSRRARFCGAVSDATVLQYAQGIFRYDNVVCGAFVGEQLRGLVELRGLFRSWPSCGEAAFSVETDWQSIGIGDALFERMFAMAQNRGVRTIQMTCLRENSQMRHLAAKHSASLMFDQDAVEAVLHPYWPTPTSIVKEIVGETMGYTRLASR